MVREKQINMRLSEEEAARLDFLTGHYGINTSALLRMLLKKEERAIEAGQAGRGGVRLSRAGKAGSGLARSG